MIDARLNLVLPLETGGGTVFIHSTPLPRMVWEKYHRILSAVFRDIWQEGRSSVISATRTAALSLRDAAIADGKWDTPDGVKNGLMAEVRRLTNMTRPTARGWETMMWQDAIDQKMVSEDDVAEVENVLVFFIVVSAINLRAEIPAVLEMLVEMFNAQTTSLSSTAYADSLRTSTVAETSMPKGPVSSIPY